MTDFYLGCSGFYYNHWKEAFYPQNLAKNKWLNYYARFFNTVEVNNTFYRYPTEKLLRGWFKKTPESFRFTLKANRAITHTYKFHNTEQLTQNFYKLAYMLRDKLLGVLFQLPPTTHKNIDLLQTIADQLDPTVMNILEFRHESWWDCEVYDFMNKHGIVFCSVSASELPEDIVASGSAIYVRFHGKNGWYMHNYPDDELAVWSKKIKQQNAARVLCYFNNDFNANATRNCLTLKKFLELNVRNAEGL